VQPSPGPVVLGPKSGYSGILPSNLANRVNQIRSRIKSAVIFGAAVAGSSCNPGAGKVAYVGGSLWDGTGGAPISDVVIIVDSDTIEAVGSGGSLKVPRGADIKRIDGKWVIPGLIDAHAHSERWMLRPFVSYGITTVRDGGGNPDSLVALREAVSLGTEIGPRLYIAGAEIDGIPPHSADAAGVRTPVEARRAVDDVKLILGSHAIISTKITRTVLQALLDEAGLLQVPVAAHLGRIDAVTAARAGVRSIEHLSGVVEATVPNPAAYLNAHRDYYQGWTQFLSGWSRLDSAALDRTARRLAELNVVMVPTLVNQTAFSNLQSSSFIGGLDLTAVPENIVNRWAIPTLVLRAGITSTDFANFRIGLRNQALFIRRFRAAGGTVVAGTNSPKPLLAPGRSLHDELAAFVALGMTPEEALLSATRDAAALLGADSLGTVRPGGAADFVVLNGNPLTDISNSASIDQVIVRGVGYVRLDLIR
jgi:imidazolonepropionase-like amidohydrolase